MQLSEFQRKALLFRTAKILYNGDRISLGPRAEIGRGPRFEFIGDIIDKPEDWLKSCGGVGSEQIKYLKRILPELTGLGIGTKLDHRTQSAFEEAKHNFRENQERKASRKLSPENCWPSWYHLCLPHRQESAASSATTH